MFVTGGRIALSAVKNDLVAPRLHHGAEAHDIVGEGTSAERPIRLEYAGGRRRGSASQGLRCREEGIRRPWYHASQACSDWRL